MGAGPGWGPQKWEEVGEVRFYLKMVVIVLNLEGTESERLSDLPKITQLRNGEWARKSKSDFSII